MASSSSVSSSLYKYDAFISFRGEETRKGFVSHLYDKLVNKGVYTFKDDKKLEKGSYIAHTLLKAIENSRYAIVVISSNYASSTWCLEELAKIMERGESGLLTVLPIFYEVDPSDVRNQRGNFAEAFKDHDEKFRNDPKKVLKWRKALTYVASIAGEDTRTWQNEAEHIQNIVRNIQMSLFSMLVGNMDDLVGMEARLKEVAPLIYTGFANESRFIGIWGMGGVGKTTIATCLYTQCLHQFQVHCFIEVTRRYDMQDLQGLLLSRIFNDKDLLIPQSCFNSIKARLGHLKVLVVIDNVDRSNQLEALAKSVDWFGLGSRIIITTRDKHLLVAHGVKHMYEVKCLIQDEALQLFRQYAFKQRHPKDGFKELSIQVVHQTDGLPLALKVLGSYLCGRSRVAWESALCKLRKIPHREINEVLKVSYDGLEDEESKSMFLHIACLFENWKLADFKKVMDACGYCTEIGIQVLVERSLLEIQFEGEIKMHDLLRRMGKYIVYGRHNREPEKCQFLMDSPEFFYVCANNLGTEMIEGISLFHHWRPLFSNNMNTHLFVLNDKAFITMPNLKFLIINWGHKADIIREKVFPPGLTYLSPRLKLLCWECYPSESLPPGFCPEFLVILDMPWSNLKKLWDGTQRLKNLRRITLRNSYNFEELPDLSMAINLEVLDLCWCVSLVEVHSSIESLGNLTSLNLSYCLGLKKIPKINSRYLKFLDASHTLIEEMPPWISKFSCLVSLIMFGCKELRNFPTTIDNLTALKEIRVGACEMLESFPTTFKKLKSLEKLCISSVPKIKKFPCAPRSLKELSLIKTAIEEIPSRIEKLSHLRSLTLSQNIYLKSISSTIFKLGSLKRLVLSYCPNLEMLPPEIPECTSYLEVLDIRGTCMKVLPTNLGRLTSLQVFRAGNMAMVQDPCLNMNSRKDFLFSQYSNKPDGVRSHCPLLSNFMAMTALWLTNLNLPQFPDDLGDLSNLTDLNLCGNDFKWVPTSIKYLSRLMSLKLNNCPKLQWLPEVPEALRVLLAQGCVSLEVASIGAKHLVKYLNFGNCFKLGQDVEILVQRMASPERFEKDQTSRILLPGSRVPRYLNRKAAGAAMTIHPPRGFTGSKFVGFVACVVITADNQLCTPRCSYCFNFNPADFVKSEVVTPEYPLEIIDFESDGASDPVLSEFEARYRCCFRVKLEGKDFAEPQVDIPMFLPEKVDIESDHLFLFTHFFERSPIDRNIDMAAACDEISFDFDLRHSWDQGICPTLKIKECGVRLLFSQDIEGRKDDTMTPSDSNSDSGEEEPSSSEKSIIRNLKEAGSYRKHEFANPEKEEVAGELITDISKPMEVEKLLNMKTCHEPRRNRDGDEAKDKNADSKRIKIT